VQRMTVVRLRGGGLWVHAPLALTAECQQQLRRLGPVAHVVLPCTSPEHWYYGPRFLDAFPDAQERISLPAPHASPLQGTSCSDAEVANRAIRFWRGRQKMALDDGQIPNVRGVRVHVSTGYTPLEGNQRASRNGLVSDLPKEILTISQLLHRLYSTHSPPRP
jgi:hypothetical protein